MNTIKEQFDEQTGRVTVAKSGFTFVVDGYDSETVEAYNDRGKLPQYIREYTLSAKQRDETKDLPYARWEMLCDMAEKLVRKN